MRCQRGIAAVAVHGWAAAAPRARIALRVLVLHHRAERVQHGLGGEVLFGCARPDRLPRRKERQRRGSIDKASTEAGGRTSDAIKTMLSSCRRFSDSMMLVISWSVSVSGLFSSVGHCGRRNGARQQRVAGQHGGPVRVSRARVALGRQPYGGAGAGQGAARRLGDGRRAGGRGRGPAQQEGRHGVVLRRLRTTCGRMRAPS